MITVADRFSFTLSEIENMKLRKLDFWYEAAKILINRESEAFSGGK